ncbi:MAG: hypothetical protein LBD17_01875, partial [Endomicrobium sp.]|nr:hypothetical protein [Endomicrobium sp.]
MEQILKFLKKIIVRQREIIQRNLIMVSIEIKAFSSKQWLSIFIVNTILLSFVYGDTTGQLLANMRESERFRQIFSEFTLPYSYGKITMANFSASDRVIINIQDLHMHPEAQRNIKSIIAEFDKTYGIDRVYLEGAYGELDTSWLADINDKEEKVRVLDKVADTGILTGPEYYSAASGRKNLIKGLENKEPYLENLKRFGDILENEKEITQILDAVGKDIQSLRSMYYNNKQKKMESMYMDYTDGKMNAEKYYGLMNKYTESMGLDLNRYENIATYLEMLNEKKNIDFDRATKELQMLVMRLKEVLPYNAYKIMEEKTKEFKEIDKLYAYIVKLSRENNINLSINFPELEKFFGYIELGKKLNPLDMIKEEEHLRGEINAGFASDQGSHDIVFMTLFERYIRDYLNSKIMSDDYEYYKINIDKFKKMWVKYVDNSKMAMLKKYEEEADKFYSINLARNEYFVENIDLIKGARKLEKDYGDDLSEEAKVIKSLKDSVEIGVVVTGGFHTRGISDLLAKGGISYIVITPNVSGGVNESEKMYYDIAKEQGKILGSGLATLVQTGVLKAGQLDLFGREIAGALVRDNVGMEQINEIFKAFVIENAEIKLTTLDRDNLDNLELEVKKPEDAASKKYKYNSTNKKFEEIVAPALPTVPGAKSVESAIGVVSRTSIGLVITSAILSAIVAVLFTLLAGTLWFLLPLIPLCLLALTSIYIVPTLIYQAIQARFLGSKEAQQSEPLQEELINAEVAAAGETTILEDNEEIIDVTKARMLRKIIIALPTDVGIEFIQKAFGIERSVAVRLLNYTGDEKENNKRDIELAKLIDNANAEGLTDGEMMRCTGYGENTRIQINFRLLRNKFFDKNGKDVIEKELLETIIEHELEHYKYATSQGRIKKLIHKFAWLEEILVSLRDGFIRVQIGIRNLFKLNVRSGQTELDVEALIEQFRLMQSVKYGDDAYNSPKTNSQIAAALEVAQTGAVATLGTGGGKSDMGKLAMAIILAREWRGGRQAGILYSSARDNLTTRDLAELAKFLNTPEILNIFKTIPNTKGSLIQVINGKEMIVVGHILPSTQSATIYGINGEPIEGKTQEEIEITKDWLYANAAIVGGDKSTLVWDFEDAMTEDNAGQKAKKRIGVFDEAHTLLDELNQSFVQSNGQERKPGQLNLQKKALTYINELTEKDYKVTNGTAELTQEGRREVAKYFSDNSSEPEFTNFTSDEWLQIVTWALTAREYEDGKEYTTNNRIGKVFESQDKSVKIELEVKKDRAGEPWEIKGKVTIEGQTYPILLNATFSEINNINQLLEVLNKDYKVLADLARDADWADISPEPRTFVDIISATTTEVSESSKWTGLHAAIELYLEKSNSEKYNFAGNYSIDTMVRRRYGIAPWMQSLVGVTGYTGTMPVGFFNRTLAQVFKRGIKAIESGAVAKPTIARAKLFERSDDRMSTVIGDMAKARTTLADGNALKNGMLVFGSIGELRNAEAKIREEHPEITNIITIDGERDSAEDIEKKISLLKENTDYLVLATNIVSIGVDAPFGFVFNAMAESQNEDERKQLRDRAGRSGNLGIVREYYSIEDIEENDETRDLIRQLKKSSSRISSVKKDKTILADGNLMSGQTDDIREIFKVISLQEAESGSLISDSGIRIVEGLTKILRERGIDTAVRTMNRNAREVEILNQFTNELQVWKEDGIWLSRYFKIEKNSDEHRALEVAFGGPEALEAFRKNVYESIERNMELFLTAQEDIDAQEDARFADSRTSVLLGMLEVSAAGEKVIAREKLFYGAAVRVAQNLIKEEFGKKINKEASTQEQKLTNKELEKYIKTSKQVDRRSWIVRFFHWIASSLMFLVSKLVTFAIPFILGGGLLGLVITSVMSSFSVGIPAALQFFVNVALFLSGSSVVALPIGWIVAIAVALVVLVIVLNAFVKRITVATEEQDNENIEKYRQTGRGGIAAFKGTVNKTLTTIARIGLTIGAISLVIGFMIPGLGMALIATGIFMFAIGGLVAIILMIINRKVLRDKKVAPSTTTKKVGRSIGFGLMVGAVLVVSILATITTIGIGWGILIGLGIALLILLAKFAYDRLTGDAVDLKTSFFTRENIISLALSVIVSIGLLLGLFFGASTILGLVLSVVSSAITIGFGVLTLMGAGVYIWNKIRGKDRVSVQSYEAADTSISSKAGAIFKGLLTIIIPLAFCALMLYGSGILTLGLWLILIAVVAGAMLAVIIWFFVGTEKMKQLTMMTISAAGTALTVVSNINKATGMLANAPQKEITKEESESSKEEGSQGQEEPVPSQDLGESKPAPIRPASVPPKGTFYGTQAQQPQSSPADIAALKNSNEYTRNAREMHDEHGKYYWLITVDGQTYRIYPYHEDGSLLTPEQLNAAVQAAPMIKWLQTNYPKLTTADINNILFDASGLLRNGISWNGHEIVNGDKLVTNYINEQQQIQNIINLLKEAGYSVGKLEYEGKNAIPVITISKNGLTIKVYPQDKIEGKNTFSLENINHVFGIYDALKTISDLKGYTIRYITEGTPHFRVTDPTNPELSIDIYPFKADGSPTTVAEIEHIFNVYETLKGAGYTVTYVEGDTPYFRVTDRTTELTLNVYLLDKTITGEYSFDVNGINKIFEVYRELSQQGYTIDSVTYEGENKVPVITISKYGLTIKVYPVDVKDEGYTFDIGNINQIFNVYEALQRAGYTIDSVTYEGENKVPVITISKYGLTIKVYPVDKREDTYTFSLENINHVFEVYDALKALAQANGYEIEYIIPNDGAAPYFKVKDGTVEIDIYPFKSNETQTTIAEIQHIFNVYSMLKNIASLEGNGYTITYINEGTPHFRVTDPNTNVAIDIYPFKTDGSQTSIAEIEHIFNVYNYLKTLGYTVTYEQPAGAAPYFKVKDGTVEINFYPFDKNGVPLNLTDVQSIITVYKSLKTLATTNGYKISYIDDGENVPYFRVTESATDALIINIYPFVNGNAQTMSVETIQTLFNFYEQLKERGFTIVGDGAHVDGNGNLYFTVTKGSLEFNVYVFDKDGNVTNIDNINHIFNTYQHLIDQGYRIEIKYDRNGNIYFEVRDPDGTTIDLYPFDDHGNFVYHEGMEDSLFNAKIDGAYQIIGILAIGLALILPILIGWVIWYWLKKAGPAWKRSKRNKLYKDVQKPFRDAKTLISKRKAALAHIRDEIRIIALPPEYPDRLGRLVEKLGDIERKIDVFLVDNQFSNFRALDLNARYDALWSDIHNAFTEIEALRAEFETATGFSRYQIRGRSNPDFEAYNNLFNSSGFDLENRTFFGYSLDDFQAVRMQMNTTEQDVINDVLAKVRDIHRLNPETADQPVTIYTLKLLKQDLTDYQLEDLAQKINDKLKTEKEAKQVSTTAPNLNLGNKADVDPGEFLVLIYEQKTQWYNYNDVAIIRTYHDYLTRALPADVYSEDKIKEILKKVRDSIPVQDIENHALMWERLKVEFLNVVEATVLNKMKTATNVMELKNILYEAPPTDSISVLRQMANLGLLTPQVIQKVAAKKPDMTYEAMFRELIYEVIVKAEYDKLAPYLPDTWSDAKEVSTGQNVRERLLRMLADNTVAALVADPTRLSKTGAGDTLTIDVTQTDGPIQSSPLTLREAIIYRLLTMNPSATANSKIAELREAITKGDFQAALILLNSLTDIDARLINRLKDILQAGKARAQRNIIEVNNILANMEALNYSLGQQARDWPMTVALVIEIEKEISAEQSKIHDIEVSYNREKSHILDNEDTYEIMRGLIEIVEKKRDEDKANVLLLHKNRISQKIQEMNAFLQMKADMLKENEREVTQNKGIRRQEDMLATRMTDEKFLYIFTILQSDFVGKKFLDNKGRLETDEEYDVRIRSRNYQMYSLFDIPYDKFKEVFDFLHVTFDKDGIATMPLVISGKTERIVIGTRLHMDLMKAVTLYYSNMKVQREAMAAEEVQILERESLLGLSKAFNKCYLNLSAVATMEIGSETEREKSSFERMNDLSQISTNKTWNAIKVSFVSKFKMWTFEFWGIKTTGQKIKTVFLFILFIAIAAAFFVSYFFIPVAMPALWATIIIGFLKNMVFTIAGIFFAAAFKLPFMLFGYSEDAGMKKSYLKLSVIFSILWGGILGGLFTRGLPVAIGYIMMGGFPMIGAIITIIIGFLTWIFTASPSFQALSDYMIAQRGQLAANKENLSPEYQTKITKISFQKWAAGIFMLGALIAWVLSSTGIVVLGLPLWGVVLMVFAVVAAICMAIAYVYSWVKAKKFNKSDLLPLIGSVLAFVGIPILVLIPGLSLMAVIGIVIASFIILGIIFYKLYSKWKIDDKIEENRYERMYKDYIDKEKYGLLVPGMSVRGYLQGVLDKMYEVGLVTVKERQSWMDRLNRNDAGSFVNFQDSEARRIMDDAFMTIGLDKPPLGSKYAVPASSTILQTGKEVTNMSWDRLTGPESGDKKGTLLGKYTQAQKARWQETMRRIEASKNAIYSNVEVAAAYSSVYSAIGLEGGEKIGPFQAMMSDFFGYKKEGLFLNLLARQDALPSASEVTPKMLEDLITVWAYNDAELGILEEEGEDGIFGNGSAVFYVDRSIKTGMDSLNSIGQIDKTTSDKLKDLYKRSHKEAVQTIGNEFFKLRRKILIGRSIRKFIATISRSDLVANNEISSLLDLIRSASTKENRNNYIQRLIQMVKVKSMDNSRGRELAEALEQAILNEDEISNSDNASFKDFAAREKEFIAQQITNLRFEYLNISILSEIANDNKYEVKYRTKSEEILSRLSENIRRDYTNIQVFIEKLRNLKETDEISLPQMETDLGKQMLANIIEEVEAFGNIAVFSNTPVIQSMARDVYQKHVDLAKNAGDYGYLKAIQEVIADPQWKGSLEAAFNSNSLPKDGVFMQNYIRYRSRVREINLPTISNYYIERDIEMQPGDNAGDSAKVKEIRSLEAFLKKLRQKQTPKALDLALKIEKRLNMLRRPVERRLAQTANIQTKARQRYEEIRNLINQISALRPDLNLLDRETILRAANASGINFPNFESSWTRYERALASLRYSITSLQNTPDSLFQAEQAREELLIAFNNIHDGYIVSSYQGLNPAFYSTIQDQILPKFNDVERVLRVSLVEPVPINIAALAPVMPHAPPVAIVPVLPETDVMADLVRRADEIARALGIDAGGRVDQELVNFVFDAARARLGIMEKTPGYLEDDVRNRVAKFAEDVIIMRMATENPANIGPIRFTGTHFFYSALDELYIHGDCGLFAARRFLHHLAQSGVLGRLGLKTNLWRIPNEQLREIIANRQTGLQYLGQGVTLTVNAIRGLLLDLGIPQALIQFLETDDAVDMDRAQILEQGNIAVTQAIIGFDLASEIVDRILIEDDIGNAIRDRGYNGDASRLHELAQFVANHDFDNITARHDWYAGELESAVQLRDGFAQEVGGPRVSLEELRRRITTSIERLASAPAAVAPVVAPVVIPPEPEVREVLKEALPEEYMYTMEANTAGEIGNQFEQFRRENLFEIEQILKENPDLVELWQNMTTTMSTFYLANFYGIDIAWHPTGDRSVMAMKSTQQSENLDRMSSLHNLMLDAQTARQIGQNEFSSYLAASAARQAYNGVIAINHSLSIPGTELGDDGTPLNMAANVYGATKKTFSRNVRSGLDGFLTFYGQGTLVGTLGLGTGFTTVEDTEGVAIQQAYFQTGGQITKNVPRGMHMTLGTMEWARHNTGAGATERRYATNVSRLEVEVFGIIDRGQKAGWDRKLVNNALSYRYQSSFLGFIFVTIFPILIMFSSFAYLAPFLLALSLILMLSQSSSVGMLFAEVYDASDAIVGLFKWFRDIIRGFPLLSNQIPASAQGIEDASSDIYEFGGTIKSKRAEEAVGGALTKVRYENKPVSWGKWVYIFGAIFVVIVLVMVLLTGPFGLLPALGGFAGFGKYLIFAAITALIPAVIAASWVDGKNAYGAFVQKDGSIKSENLFGFWNWGFCWKVLGMFFFILLTPLWIVLYILSAIFWIPYSLYKGKLYTPRKFLQWLDERSESNLTSGSMSINQVLDSFDGVTDENVTFIQKQIVSEMGKEENLEAIASILGINRQEYILRDSNYTFLNNPSSTALAKLFAYLKYNPDITDEQRNKIRLLFIKVLNTVTDNAKTTLTPDVVSPEFLKALEESHTLEDLDKNSFIAQIDSLSKSIGEGKDVDDNSLKLILRVVRQLTINDPVVKERFDIEFDNKQFLENWNSYNNSVRRQTLIMIINVISTVKEETMINNLGIIISLANLKAILAFLDNEDRIDDPQYATAILGSIGELAKYLDILYGKVSINDNPQIFDVLSKVLNLAKKVENAVQKPSARDRDKYDMDIKERGKMNFMNQLIEKYRITVPNMGEVADFNQMVVVASAVSKLRQRQRPTYNTPFEQQIRDLIARRLALLEREVGGNQSIKDILSIQDGFFDFGFSMDSPGWERLLMSTAIRVSLDISNQNTFTYNMLRKPLKRPFDVKFDANGGTRRIPKDIHGAIKYGKFYKMTSVGGDNIPQREGWEFDGYVYTVEGTSISERITRQQALRGFKIDKLHAMGNVTFTLQWKTIVTIKDGEGQILGQFGVVSGTYGDTVSLIGYEAKLDSKPTSWQRSDGKALSDPITEPVTFIPVNIAATIFDVKYKYNGAQTGLLQDDIGGVRKCFPYIVRGSEPKKAGYLLKGCKVIIGGKQIVDKSPQEIKEGFTIEEKQVTGIIEIEFEWEPAVTIYAGAGMFGESSDPIIMPL